VDSPNESTRDDNSQTLSSRILDSWIIPFYLVALATLAAAGAFLRVFGSGGTGLVDRLNETTLLYLAVGGALLLLNRIKTLSFGSYKLEMLEQIRERQVRTEDLLKNVTSKLLPLLLPEAERSHLMNLDRGHTNGYTGGDPVQAELRRLISVGLLEKKRGKHLSDLKSGYKFDLADYVELTPLGVQWIKTIRDIERGDQLPASQPAQES
jgi:hypothetical protein